MYSGNGSTDAVRREQAVEGQRMARGESTTLHRKPAPRLKSATQGNKQGKPKLEGHEFFLKELEKSGARIRVAFLDDDMPVDGTVSHSDKFTITLRTQTVNHGIRDIVYFKHAIKAFYPIDLRTKEPAPSTESDEEVGVIVH